jgi:hypothetical protein
MSCRRPEVRICHDPIMGCYIGRCSLNRLNPQTFRRGVKPDLKCSAGLAGVRSKPTAKEIGEPIARGSGGAGGVAVLFCKPELPDCSIRKTNVSFTLGDSGAGSWRELYDRIALV